MKQISSISIMCILFTGCASSQPNNLNNSVDIFHNTEVIGTEHHEEIDVETTKEEISQENSEHKNNISSDILKKYAIYNPSSVKSAEEVYQHHLEQRIIGKIWFPKEQIYFEYLKFSTPIIKNIDSKYSLKRTPSIISSLENFKNKKTKVLQENFDKTTHSERIALQPLFIFPIEFETQLLKEGFFHSLAPFYFEDTAEPFRFEYFIDGNLKIFNKNKEALSLKEMESIDVLNLSFNAKNCINSSNLPTNQITENLIFAKKLFAYFNFYKMNSILSKNLKKDDFIKLKNNENNYKNEIEKEFISFYHYKNNFDKFKQISCDKVFEKYQNLYDNYFIE